MSTSPERAVVLLIGAGGVGAPAAWALGAAGVGELRVLDDDAIELSNLHRQILFEESDVGATKVDALARALSTRAPGTRVIPIRARATPESLLAYLEGVDVVIDGTDRFAVRFLAADAARLAEKPVVHAAAVRWQGTVMTAGPRGGPCYRCLFEDLPSGPAPDCTTAGVVGPVCGVIGGLAADAALAVLAGDEAVLGTIATFDGLRGSALRRVRVAARAACPLCGDARTISTLSRDRYVAPACEV